MNLVLGILLFLQLPQVLEPEFKAPTPIKAGAKGEIVVSFKVLEGYAISREPLPITLKLNEVQGLKLEKTTFATPAEDPKAKDEYYVDLPALRIPLTAAKAGKYEVSGKLTYFFCSKTDGFCSRQAVDVKAPVTIQ